MSEEEIKAMAAELGLDPEKLILFEPFAWPHQWVNPGWRYRFEYVTGGKAWAFYFVIDPESVACGIEDVWVKHYVNQGLRELVEKVAT